MKLNLEIDAGLGRGAIWKGEDRAPFTDPRDNLDRVLWHSALDYIRIVETRRVTLNLPEREDIQEETESYVLFAHGRPGIPFILGAVDVGAEPVAFAGSVPVQMGTDASGGGIGSYGRWLALGADFDNVAVHEYVVGRTLGGNNYPAVSLDITVHLTSKILEGPDVPPPQADLEISRARFALGPLDSDIGYIQRVADPARRQINAARGTTFDFNVARVGSSSNAHIAWRWRCGSATQVGIGSNAFVFGIEPPDGFTERVDLTP